MKIISDKPNSLGMFLGIQSDIYQVMSKVFIRGNELATVFTQLKHRNSAAR